MKKLLDESKVFKQIELPRGVSRDGYNYLYSWPLFDTLDWLPRVKGITEPLTYADLTCMDAGAFNRATDPDIRYFRRHHAEAVAIRAKVQWGRITQSVIEEADGHLPRGCHLHYDVKVEYVGDHAPLNREGYEFARSEFLKQVAWLESNPVLPDYGERLSVAAYNAMADVAEWRYRRDRNKAQDRSDDPAFSPAEAKAIIKAMRDAQNTGGRWCATSLVFMGRDGTKCAGHKLTIRAYWGGKYGARRLEWELDTLGYHDRRGGNRIACKDINQWLTEYTSVEKSRDWKQQLKEQA